MGGLQIPRCQCQWLGSDPLSAWWLGLAPATLEFWVRFPNERNQGKQAHPVLKYRVPHGSHFHCACPLLPSSARSAGQRNQPSHSTVLARPVCLFVCVGAAFLPCARPLLPSSDRSVQHKLQLVVQHRLQPAHDTKQIALSLSLPRQHTQVSAYTV